MRFYPLAIDLTVVLHFLFILFVIFGALLCWRHRFLRWVHGAALLYGLLIEVFNWYCPLTLLELWLRRQAGLRTYQGSFIARHLKSLIYWDVPQWVLIAAAAVVVVANAAFYAHVARRQGKNRLP